MWKRLLPKKLRTGLELFQKGRMVANPKAWKEGQVTVECLSAFAWAAIAAVAVYFDIEVQVGSETVDSASGAILALVASVERLYSAASTVITTNKVGLQEDNNSDD